MSRLSKLEIELLREETLQIMNQNVELAKFGVTVTGALIAAGLAINNEASAYVLLLPQRVERLVDEDCPNQRGGETVIIISEAHAKRR